MSNGRLERIGQRETADSRKGTLYLLGIVVVALIIVAAFAYSF
jgi:hypothetical protein